MGYTIALNIFAVSFSFLEGRGLKGGLFISFAAIFFFSAIRYNYGNDYISYLESFKEINSIEDFDFFNEATHFEPGWLILCKLFNSIGFFGLVIFLSLLNSLMIYKFIKKYIPKELFWLAVFIYLFTPNLFLVQLSTMRQTLVILIFTFSSSYISQKKLIPFLICITIGFSFHTSALILLPTYFLGYFKLRVSKIAIIIIIALYINFIFIANEILAPFIEILTLAFHEGYKVYDTKGEVVTGFGLIFNILLLIFFLYMSNYLPQKEKFIFNISLCGFLITPFALQVELIARLGFYFETFHIILLPLLFLYNRNVFLKYSITSIYCLFLLYLFFSFFQSPISKDYYNTYQTIFSAEQWY